MTDQELREEIRERLERADRDTQAALRMAEALGSAPMLKASIALANFEVVEALRKFYP